jgi:predicted PurR-regulated permease PerM
VKIVFANPWVRLLALLLFLALLLWGLLRLGEVFTPFAVAFGLAYFLNPAVNGIERFFNRLTARSPWLARHLRPRVLAVGLLAVVVAAILALILAFGVPAAYRQVAETAGKIPEYAKVLRAKIEPVYDRLNLRYPDYMEEARARLEELARTHFFDVLSPLTRALRAAFTSLLSFVLALLNVVIVPVFTVYLLYDMNRIKEGISELVPHRLRPYVFSRFGQVDRLLSAFVRGQITVCLILGVFYAIGLTAGGVPMGLLVGFVIGFFNLIPFMSYVLGLPLALLLSWLDDQDPSRLIAVAAVFTFGQFVEGNFITPRIVGESLGLPAVVIMLAVLVGGTIFGFVGMLLAVPTAAVLSVFWADLRKLYLESEFYRRGVPPTG